MLDAPRTLHSPIPPELCEIQHKQHGFILKLFHITQIYLAFCFFTVKMTLGQKGKKNQWLSRTAVAYEFNKLLPEGCECLCIVPCNELAFLQGCIPASHSLFPGSYMTLI